MPPPETVSTQYAGFISRSTAFVIDLLLITLVTFLATTVISVIAQFFDLGLTQITLDDQTTLTPLQALVTLAAGLLQMFLGLVYFLFFWVLVGFTPGMGLLGIRVIRCDQQRLGLGRAIVRYIGYWVALIFLGLGFIWILFDRRRQGWHDKLAGTCVIYFDEEFSLLRK